MSISDFMEHQADLLVAQGVEFARTRADIRISVLRPPPAAHAAFAAAHRLFLLRALSVPGPGPPAVLAARSGRALCRERT
ncbi:hypothetical protein [Ramlibacter sp. Leaf400]|uniref:hypothetical protein n=1 Tax=Ramlibacter sp. Leaf400 TaxID=1736365 RepID=UPI0006FF924B|nr:hypothetical protein [Ramlibacter sp. Leaf400]KQT07560.1 hypothetical protein ASG30_17130 [Ramlibacter sp. Leaf400]